MMKKLTDQEFHAIETYVRAKYGLNLEKKRYLIESKLWIELARCKAETYTAYWQTLLADHTGKTEQRMMDLLTTNYTYFCREEQHFNFLRDVVLPQTNLRDPLHIWCAACATGQECYTLAMMLLDCQRNGLLKVPFSILGTDISESSLNTAKRASYGSADYARLPAHWQSYYCTPFSGNCFQVKDNLRNLVQFQWQNLLTPPVQRNFFQIIFCRNVLIYLKNSEQNQLISNVTKALAPEGYFFTGHTETLLGSTMQLEYIKPAVYRKTEAATHEQK